MNGAWYRKKSILAVMVLVIFALAIGSFIYVYQHRDRQTYCMDQPAIETVKSISIEQNAEGVTYTDTEDIKNLLKVIYGVKMITEKDSIQDSPVNVEDEIAIHISLTDENVVTLFTYKRNFKYYIEMPYNGIYDIDEETYSILKEHLK